MVKLFGGALEMKLPSDDFIDVSQLRQVPDNQEVFLDKHSDLSIIVELLEHDTAMTLEQHFTQLAEDNDAESFAILAREGDCLHGTQMASKFNKTDVNTLHLYLGLHTITTHKTDILVSLNSPGEQNISFDAFTTMFKSLTVNDASIFCTE